MARNITIDRDHLVSLLQTFYNQGFDDAAHSPAPFDMKEAAEFQLNLLEAERDLIEWEKKEGLFIDTRPDDEAQDYDTFGNHKI